jgi:hypothetical protein
MYLNSCNYKKRIKRLGKSGMAVIKTADRLRVVKVILSLHTCRAGKPKGNIQTKCLGYNRPILSEGWFAC